MYVCNKRKRNEMNGRFNFPLPVIVYPRILRRFSEEEKLGELLKKFKKIRNLMHSYFMRTQLFHAKDALAHLEIPEMCILWQYNCMQKNSSISQVK
jgi:archaellum biogenesis protein FlaJ (TadC family)